MADLARLGRRKHRNKHRDLMRRLSRLSEWPKLYYIPVRCWNNRLQLVEQVEIPVVLPHELLHRIGQRSNLDSFASAARLTEQTREHLRKAARSLLADGAPIVPLGLWLDGTPCNWDRLFVWRWKRSIATRSLLRRSNENDQRLALCGCSHLLANQDAVGRDYGDVLPRSR